MGLKVGLWTLSLQGWIINWMFFMWFYQVDTKYALCCHTKVTLNSQLFEVLVTIYFNFWFLMKILNRMACVFWGFFFVFFFLQKWLPLLELHNLGTIAFVYLAMQILNNGMGDYVNRGIPSACMILHYLQR